MSRAVPVLLRWVFLFCVATTFLPADVVAAGLLAGASKVEITDRTAGPVNDPLFVKALVIRNETTTLVIVTVDAVALGEIGPIPKDYLSKVRARLEKGLGIRPSNVLVNASHCHGLVCADVGDRTVNAVEEAVRNLVPVKVGAGAGLETRVMENRRLRLKDGREADVRHAYALPPDADVAEVGPVDPQIGILRLDREDGRTLAVVYNFACHPIQGVPGRANTADISGFASQVIEDNLGEGAIALFLQGCGGDINPRYYKDVDHPRSAEPLGQQLGLSVLKGVRSTRTQADGRLTVINETMKLPRADFSGRIAALEAERLRLVESLQGTSLNLKTFLPLHLKYSLGGDAPSSYSHGYLSDRAAGRNDLMALDAENRENLRQYTRNVLTMEELTRVQTNLALLKMHQKANASVRFSPVEVELLAVRVGDLVLTTFPGELTVRIGLALKKASPHPHTLVAGYTNGYIFYAPTAEQLRNPGAAQEDCDTILAPEWQALYEAQALGLLKRL